MQIEIINMPKALQYCLGTDKTDGFATDILNTLIDYAKPSVAYHSVDIFLQKS